MESGCLKVVLTFNLNSLVSILAAAFLFSHAAIITFIFLFVAMP